MRHDQIGKKHSYTKVDVAAARPASAQVAPPPLPEADESQAADFAAALQDKAGRIGESLSLGIDFHRDPGSALGICRAA